MRHNTLVTTQVRRYMKRLPEGAMFTTRELLCYSMKRASLDQALSRMVKRKEIERLALGVFRKYSSDNHPSPSDIARIKARAYRKEIVTHGADAAQQLHLTASGNVTTTFATDGQTSSFRTVSGTVNLKKASPRKLLLGDTPIGLLIRAICFIGKRFIDWRLLNQVLLLDARFGRQEREQLRTGADLMPAWISDVLCPV